MKFGHFFYLKSRTSRKQFWRVTLMAWLAFYFLSTLLNGSTPFIAVWLVNLPVLSILFCLCVRRLHDSNRSGWWLLAIVVPVLGAAWLLWRLAITPGTADTNRWGRAPDYPVDDHFQVKF